MSDANLSDQFFHEWSVAADELRKLCEAQLEALIAGGADRRDYLTIMETNSTEDAEYLTVRVVKIDYANSLPVEVREIKKTWENQQ